MPRMTTPTLSTSIVASIAAFVTGSCLAADLHLLGPVPYSYAESISGDGSVVAGTDMQGQWVWTLDSWVVRIEGTLPVGNGVGGRPRITEDGLRVMCAKLEGTDPRAEAVIYDRTTGEFDTSVGNLGYNCDISRMSGWDMTPSGSHVAGLANVGFCSALGFVWDAATDTIKQLPATYFYKPTRANGISHDGAFVCGWNDDYTGFRQGCVWKLDANGNYVPKLLNTGVATSKLREAECVSGNGVWAYGQGSPNTGGAPYRWSYATGYQPIVPLPPGNPQDGFVTHANYDGSMILTYMGGVTYLWIEGRGYVSLHDWATEKGYALTTDWVFRGFSMTEDGLTVVGDALRLADGVPSPFVLDLRPSAPACPADLDGDGMIGAPDLSLLLAAWGSFGSDADLDGDDQVGAADLSLMLAAWGKCQ
jgi:uncharacterized membrane protein